VPRTRGGLVIRKSILVDRKHLDELIEIERSYWWHIAKRMIVTEILKRYFPPPARLIEGGFGAGWNLLAFKELGYQITGFDIMPESVETGKNHGLSNVAVHDLQNPWPVEKGSTRVVVMLDVLEHTSDPSRVLKNAALALDDRGGIVLTVPAIPCLMGPWDLALGHHFRYSIRLLRRQADDSGLRVLWVSYWNAFSLPAAFFVRGIEKLFQCRHSERFPRVLPGTNALLIWCANIERLLIRKMPIPYGLSLVGVLVK
jgi:SAM-dependent methyltransferase